MPLIISSSVDGENWVEAGKIYPGQRPGSISNNKDDGTREIILFGCDPNGEKSTISLSELGLDHSLGVLYRVVKTARARVIATLNDGESHTMEVRTDRGVKSYIRFTHNKNETSVQFTPEDLIVAAYSYFGTDCLDLASLINVATAAAWGKPTPPPIEMFRRMAINVEGVLEHMIKEGKITKISQPDGSVQYKLNKVILN